MASKFACRVCGSADAGRRFDVREMMFGTRQKFAYTECATCRGLQIDSIPEDLPRHYPPNYYAFGFGQAPLPWRRKLGIVLRRIQLAARYGGVGSVERVLTNRLGRIELPSVLSGIRLSSGARILDVGCGNGELLLALRDCGFRRLNGVDPFIQTSIRYDMGVSIEKADVADITGPFDVIMLHHVLEHVEDPCRVLAACERLLAPEGQLLLRLPTVPCEAFDRYGADWVQLDAPRHLHILSRSGIEALAQACRLEVVGWEYDSEPLQFWGSEQYRNDIPLFDERSYSRDKSQITPERLLEMEIGAKQLNKVGRGDQAAAILHRRSQ